MSNHFSNTRLFFLTLFIWAGTWTTGMAQYGAKASVDSTHMLIGDQLRLHVDVMHTPGVAVLPVAPPTGGGSAVEFLGKTDWDTLSNDGRYRLQMDLVFTAWDSGYQVVPSLPVVFVENGKSDTVYTTKIPIEVFTPKVDSTLADIKPIIEEPTRWEDYLPMAAGVLALAVIAWIWYMLATRKRKKDLPPPPPPPPVPAHIVALEKLEGLKQAKLWQQGQVKEFHSRLTFIIREYLENRYGIQALEQTTDEILEQMKNIHLGVERTEKMKALLQTADLVKFAKAEPPADYHDQAWQMGEDFVRSTHAVISSLEENKPKAIE